MMPACVRVCMEASGRAWKRACTSRFAYVRGWRIKTATQQKKKKQNKTFLARRVQTLNIPKTLSKNTASDERCYASLSLLQKQQLFSTIGQPLAVMMISESNYPHFSPILILIISFHPEDGFKINKYTFFELLILYTHNAGEAGNIARAGMLSCVRVSLKNKELSSYITEESSGCIVSYSIIRL